jgi:LemA protein
MSKNDSISKEDLDDIIGIASLLEEKEQDAERISLEEVQSVASELGISPDKVQEALTFLQNRRKEEKEKQELEKKQRKQSITIVAALSAGMALMCVICIFIMASSASSSLEAVAEVIQEKQQQMTKSKAQLNNVLDRQAQLIPQLTAMMGGDVSALEQSQKKLSLEKDIDKKLQLSQQLTFDISKAIGALPTPANAADSQKLLNFQYEVTGSQNRISTEKKRYDEILVELTTAQQEWDKKSSGLGARLSLSIGMSEDISTSK